MYGSFAPIHSVDNLDNLNGGISPSILVAVLYNVWELRSHTFSKLFG